MTTTATPLSQADFESKLYKFKSGQDQVKSEATYGYMVESIEINNGVYSHIMGMEYPEKGVVLSKDIFATNMIKRLVLESIKLLKYAVPLLAIFVLLPWKRKLRIVNSLMSSFSSIGMKIMSPSLLQHQHLTPMAQELFKFLNNLCKHLGIDEKEYTEFNEIIINVINFDNAYRYRIQDLFDETTKEKLSNPRKEFKRLLAINQSREVVEYKWENGTETSHWDKAGIWMDGDVIFSPHHRVKGKFKIFYLLFSLILAHPRVKKAYLLALNDLDLSKVQMDKADWFWTCVRDGYLYHGMTKKERYMAINNLKYVIPTKIML